MSLENEEESSAMEATESINEAERKPRISYTRDFLLTFSELEICKKLPSGFDQSLLSEFEEHSVLVRPRNHGNLPLQGLRRNDYSSSPPTRGDSGNFSRGAYGRWDNRSSNWNDKDGDSQSEVDPDSGRRNYSRRPWQNSEHDGLLGSGSFPRPSGFAAGTSAPKSQSNEPYHLSRSNEAYQPPRPFKAVPHTRPNTHDSFNDETFGSTDNTTQDRAEEERKRRASFELMRKEQQKVLQEKQKSSANKVKSDAFSDLILEETKEEGVLEASGELNSSVPNDDSAKSSSILLQSSKPRPLVPPGFKSTILEKSSITKPITSTDKENPKSGLEEIQLLAKGNKTQNGTIDNLQDNNLHKISGFPQLHDPQVFDLMANKVMPNTILTNPTQESTSSILGKIFGSAPPIKDAGPTSFLEQKSKPDDPLSPRNVQSSRFAQWFSEDEKKPLDDLSSNRPNDLLSLIVGGDKTLPQVPDIISTDPMTPDLLSFKGFGGITKTPSDSKHLYNSFRLDPLPAPAPVPAPPVAAVLTCEDLEQTILSEYTDKSPNLPPPVPEWSHDQTDARPVDNRATHHLLSLLQKGTTADDIKPSDSNIGSSEKHLNPEVGTIKTSENTKDANSSKNLSLESLFGSAFMKELQSAQAPVSVINGPLSNESNPLLSKQKQPATSDDNDTWRNLTGPGDIHLPEEESLITVNDSSNSFDISEKLAALNSGFRVPPQQEANRFVRGPYEMLDSERQIHQMNQMNQMSQMNNNNRRPMFHPMDQMNNQMRFPEHLIQRENSLNNQQFGGNINMQRGPFHQPDNRVTGFDVHVPPPHHPQMLPPQMRMQQGNYPPPHLMRDLPRPSNFMPFAHQQANIGGLGMPLPGPDGGSSGSNHPEAFQRMMEMELRAQSKQVRPVNASQGMYGGHELDMGFRYR